MQYRKAPNICILLYFERKEVCYQSFAILLLAVASPPEWDQILRQIPDNEPELQILKLQTYYGTTNKKFKIA